MTDGDTSKRGGISPHSPKAKADDFMVEFDRRHPGLVQEAEQAFLAENTQRRQIFYFGSAIIIAGAVMLWWLSNQELTTVSPWSAVIFVVGLLLFNWWKKGSATQTFRERFRQAGVTDDEYRSLRSAAYLAGYPAFTIVAMASLGSGAHASDGGGGMEGGGDGGGGCGGGCGGGG